ncbi:uncharacterized protein LOC127831270 [Dreissena polymorpha]|uniref:uncharacterized protein LOC127831270 n=1 Tax=Dreissena polymorpha TaxID=45954 RepID=UPI002263C28C|nr:uncharacterized protein LOC127831270 [Dreissena polymorpha]
MLFLFKVLGQHLLLTSNVPVVEENNPLTFTCVLPSKGANTGWIVNGVRTETALLDDGRCIQPSVPPQGFIYTCVSSTVFTLTILQVKREQNGEQWTCDSWINGGTLYSNNVTLKVHVLGQRLLLTSNVPVVVENNPLTFTCVLPSKGANTGWIVNGVRTETALLDDGRCIQPSAPPQGFIYACVSSTVFTLTILQVKREQNGDQWTCDSWTNGGTLYSNNVTLKVQDHNVSERTGDVDTGSLMPEKSNTQIITYAENHTLPNNVSQWTIDAGIRSLMYTTQQTTNSQNHTSPYKVSEGTGDADIVSLMTSNAENHTLSYNVSGWTDYADLGSLMPETTTTKPITNSPKKKIA